MKLDDNNIISTRANKTIYRDGNYAIKVFNENYSKANVLNEALNQAHVEETGLHIPKIQEVLKFDGKWAIVSEFIEGTTLAKLTDENPEKFDEFMEMFVRLQLEIQSKRAPGLTKLKDKMHSKISESSLDATTRYDLHMTLDAMPKHTKVCHGDYNSGNIIVTPDGVPYVIDWSHATQGNASADVARTYLLFCLKNAKDIAEKYLALFCKLSDTPRQYVEKWLPIVAASQSVKGRPEEREFLLNWVGVVDYQ